MADSASFDAHELRQFAADLTRAPQRVVDKVPPVVKRGATQVKAQLRAEMGASPSFGVLARGITYDILDGGFTAEIGPVKADRHGKSVIGVGANIAYFGGAHGGGGTVPDPQGALDAEAPRMERAIADLIGEL
jgi:hypothetical protein